MTRMAKHVTITVAIWLGIPIAFYIFLWWYFEYYWSNI